MSETYGLGNFLYTVEVADGAAKLHFYDSDDASNTADVSVGVKDFPEGIKQPNSREVAEVAFAQCSKVLNDKRDARIKKEQAAELDKRMANEAESRDAAADILNNGQDHVVPPHHTEDDGTKVYNTAPPEDKKK